jgi:hypothetical protein
MLRPAAALALPLLSLPPLLLPVAKPPAAVASRRLAYKSLPARSSNVAGARGNDAPPLPFWAPPKRAAGGR